MCEINIIDSDIINDLYGIKKGCVKIINRNRIYKIYDNSSKKPELYLKYECENCGEESYVWRYQFTRSNYIQCPKCVNNLRSGDTVNRLTLLSSFIKNVGPSRVKMWTCKCGCGNTIDVSNYILRKSKIKTCGRCTDKERITLSVHYDRSRNILLRTRKDNHDDYPRYGGRGIKCLLGDNVQDVIRSISKVPGYKEGLQLDRIDNDGHYTIEHPVHGNNIWIDEYGHQCLGNLRWVTPQFNSSNRGTERVDMSSGLILYLANLDHTYNDIIELFHGRYISNYLKYFFVVPTSTTNDESFRLFIDPEYNHIFHRFLTCDNMKDYDSYVKKYHNEYKHNKINLSSILQRLSLRRE